MVRDTDGRQGRSNGSISDDNNNNSTNLFVRLSPGVARDLFNRSHQSRRNEDGNEDDDEDDANPNVGSSWRLLPLAGEDDDIHFLPLKITMREQQSDNGKKDATNVHTIYASFNGGIVHKNGQNNNGTFSVVELRCFPKQTRCLL